MFSEPATGGSPTSSPARCRRSSRRRTSSTGDDVNIDRCWTCRSMFMQAWGNYGTAWPVVHQQLGVRPDLGRGRVAVVPQVPRGPAERQGANIRLGDGSSTWRPRAAGRTPDGGRRGEHAGGERADDRRHTAARDAAAPRRARRHRGEQLCHHADQPRARGDGPDAGGWHAPARSDRAVAARQPRGRRTTASRTGLDLDSGQDCP